MNAREPVLREYRANPSDRNFAHVHDAYRPWFHAAGVATVRRFPTLTVAADLDDLINEGLFSLSRAARRFVYVCDRCGDVFLHLTDLREHARETHRLRGPVELVSLSRFAECSARMSMKRTAARLLRPRAEIYTEAPEVPVGGEEEVLVELLIRRAGERLSAGAAELLNRLLDGARPRIVTSEADDFAAAELRRSFPRSWLM